MRADLRLCREILVRRVARAGRVLGCEVEVRRRDDLRAAQTCQPAERLFQRLAQLHRTLIGVRVRDDTFGLDLDVAEHRALPARVQAITRLHPREARPLEPAIRRTYDFDIFGAGHELRERRECLL
jgi:hypothetical protein